MGVVYGMGAYSNRVSLIASLYEQMHSLRFDQDKRQQNQFETPVRSYMRHNKALDLQRYNLPTSHQIAFVFQSADGDLHEHQDLLSILNILNLVEYQKLLLLVIACSILYFSLWVPLGGPTI
jgi:hypothetical protein